MGKGGAERAEKEAEKKCSAILKIEEFGKKKEC